MPRICVLGGSSPFTTALIDAIVQDEALCATLNSSNLVLNGRNERNLRAVADYARHRLGPFGVIISATTDLCVALTGTDIVIVQIRFGGLEVRAADEEFARDLGSVADETLGPCGLLSAMRQLGPLNKLATTIGRVCPSAFVINMINPLSLTTSILCRHGISAVGICELPFTTFKGFAEALGADPAGLVWHYEGLNHRGFVSVVRTHDGEDMFRRVAAMQPEPAWRNYREDILRLGAIPTKYFALFDRPEPPKVGRAATLMALRDALAQELIADPAAPLKRIKEREMSWYGDAVVPLLAARLGVRGFDLTLNVAGTDDLVREYRVHAFANRIDRLVDETAQGPFREWLSALEDHERLCLEALNDLSRASIRRALEVDRLTPQRRLDDAVDRIFSLCRTDHGAVERTGRH